MKGKLTQEDIEDLLVVCGTEPTIWNSRGEMQICCPVHGERNPSMGVNSEKQICHCFSCGFAGDFPWLLFNSQPDQYSSYRAAAEFISSEYDIQFFVGETAHDITRYEDLDSKKYVFTDNVLPMFKIAPFKSGKETYKYFFRRGFTREDMTEFKIGRDIVNKTVTIPVFNSKEELLGVIGRYISKDRKKNERYKIYDHFRRGDYLFPLNKFEDVDGSIILVEGQFDAMRMHSLGHKNTLAKMGLELTERQARWIVEHCDRIIDVGDNDVRGEKGIEADCEVIKGRVDVLRVAYPDYGKDVCNWSADDIDKMLDSACSRKNRKIRRYV